MSDPQGKRDDESSTRRDRVIIFWMTTGLATLLAAILGGLATGVLQIRDVTSGSSSSTAATNAPFSTDATASTSNPNLQLPPATATSLDSGIRRQGRLALTSGFFADLDSTKPDWDVEGSAFGQFEGDIYNGGYSIDNDLVGDGTGNIVEIGKGKPNYSTCASETAYVETVEDLAIGEQFCIHTNKGRYAFLRVDGLTEKGDEPYQKMSLTVVVWEKQS